MRKLVVAASCVVTAVVVFSLVDRSGENNDIEVASVADRVAPDLQNDENLQKECAQMFRKIISIQDDREFQRLQFSQVHDAFNEDLIGKQKFSAARQAWLQRENALASKAANLYSESRGIGCFQKVEQTDIRRGE